MKKIIRLTKTQLKKIIKENVNLDELDYQGYHEDDNLQDLRDSLDKNKTVSVAFVKKDGSVRHMAVRKNLSSYVASDREKTDAQMNVQQNHNLKRVIDINAYIKELKQLRLNNQNTDTPQSEDELKQIASKKSWRSINLETVLGFLVGGKFKDLRDENNIREKFGDEVYNSLTKSMVKSMNQEQTQNQQELEETHQIQENKKVIKISESELKKLIIKMIK